MEYVFFSAIPANVFGPGDDFSNKDSNVIGGLIRKIDRAQDSDSPTVTILGYGHTAAEIYLC